MNRSLLSAFHCDKFSVRDNTDVDLTSESLLRHLQIFLNMLISLNRDMFLHDVTVTVKVLCLSLIDDSESLN